MSEPETPSAPFYVTGGTLKPGAPSYVERRADTELAESLLAGEFCYVLTARQMGKSSLMARTAKRLEQEGVCTAIVDLSQIGTERGDQAATQWYFGIAHEIHRQLRITEPLRPWWQERADLPPVQRLTGFFRDLVLEHCLGRVVIFVDEIDSTIGLPFADDFFAALRACFNVRATDASFERLTFALFGVASPDQLIKDQARTPFNIGKRIDLTDFTLEEAAKLSGGLHADPGEASRRLERILYWTGGHPYLTQAVCRTVRERDGNSETGTIEEAVDPRVEDLFLSSRAQREETNLKHARARLERPSPEKRRFLRLYLRVRQGKPVPDQPASPLFSQLKLAGVVKVTDAGKLAVRNRIYERVFTPEWVKSAIPADRSRRLAVATLAASLTGALVWYATFQPRATEKLFQVAIQADDYAVASQAYADLRTNPFSQSRATDLMQKFWEHRGLKFSLTRNRDEGLLSYLHAISLRDSEGLRRRAENLVGADYEKLKLTLRHISGLTTVAFSPDGRSVVTGSWDNTARLWDSCSGELLATLLGHTRSVIAAVFSPDGRSVVTASEDNTARLWDAQSGKQTATLMGHQDAVLAVAFSPNGRLVVTASEDNTARLWNVQSGEQIATLVGHQDGVRVVAFSPDGRAVLTGSSDKTARLWDARSRKQITPPLQHQDSVNAVAFSPDSQSVITGSADNTARLWDARSGKPISPPLRHQGAVYAVAFSPDGKTVLTGSEDSTARLWDAHSGRPIASPLQHRIFVNAVAFSSNGRTFLTSSGNTAQLWDAHSGKPVAPPLRHKSSVFDLAFSSDGETILTGSKDNTARLWSARSEKPISSPIQGQALISAVVFSPDGRAVLTSFRDNAPRLWDTRSGKPISPLLQHQASALAEAISPDGRTVLTGFSDKTAWLWDTSSGKPITTPLRHQGSVLTVAFSPDGRTVLTGSSDKTARLWDKRSGKPVTSPLQHQASVIALAFSPDGRVVLTESGDKTVRVWDARSGKPITPPLPHQISNYTAAFSPDGRFFLTGPSSETAQLWDARSGKPISPLLRHLAAINAIAFSPDGLTILTGCRDGTTRLWDARSGKLISPPLQHQVDVYTVAFSPEGKRFFVATYRWLNTYSWDGKNALLQNSQLLHGFWKRAFRFPSDCQHCLQVALGDTGNSLRIETLHLDEPNDPPIQGDPKELLEKWQKRLGLKFNEKMDLVPRY